LLQGTLDLLILKVVELGPVHGYGISQRIRQISDTVLQLQQARFIIRGIVGDVREEGLDAAPVPTVRAGSKSGKNRTSEGAP
jgi:hypothetical protein